MRTWGKYLEDRALHFREKKNIDFSGPFFNLLFNRETKISSKEKPVFRKEKLVSRKELLCLVRKLISSKEELL